mmetsp:Transcript_8078/g.15145  ORF Transcript_8078/g.15145 Transcript_8078/m.15145 type:complete len:1135 (+) Transcript_8078:46-3450(+)
MAPHPQMESAAYGAAGTRSSTRKESSERAACYRQESAERFINFGKSQIGGESPRDYLRGGAAGTGKFESAWWDTLTGEQGVDSSDPAAGSRPRRNSTVEADKRHLLDMELEMRRRRAEAVVGQWAEDTRPSSAQADEDVSGGRASHRRRSSSRTMTRSSAERGRRASDPSGDYVRGVEQQVADLRRRQAEQAQLLLAQEEQHRQQEEKTMRLLQQQAEELYWQQAQEKEQEEERLRRDQEDKQRQRSTWQDSTAEEEALSREEEEQEKNYWHSQVNDWFSAGQQDHWQRHQVNIDEDEEERRRCQQEEEEEWRRRSAEQESHCQHTPTNSYPEPLGMAGHQHYTEKENRSWQTDEIFYRSHTKDASKSGVRGTVHGERTHTMDEEQLRQQAREEVRKIKRAQQAEQQRRQQQQHTGEEERWQAQQQADEMWRRQTKAEDFWRQQQELDQERVRHQMAMEEEERRRQQAAEEERRWREEEERKRLQQAYEEEERQRLAAAEEERRWREEEEERMRQQAAEELRRQRARQEEERRQKQEEEERLWREEEERMRVQARQELRRREEAKKEERKRQQAKQEEERRKREEDERRWRDTVEEVRRQQVRGEEDRRYQQAKEEEEQRQRKKARDKEEKLRQRQEEDWTRHEATGSSNDTPQWEAKDLPRETHSTELPSEGTTDAPDAPKESSGTCDEEAEEPAVPSNESYYEVLDVAQDATDEQIRKAYKRQCMKHHPDKGGDRNRFEEVGRAYQTLSDKALRKAYDSKGLEGVERVKERERKAAESNAAGGQAEKVEKAQAIVVEAHVPLEIAFTGGDVDVQIVRIATCVSCQGSGTNPGASCIPCPTCDAQGAVQQYVQLGPMIIEQHVQCTTCAGQGMVLPSTAICAACAGETVAEEEGRVHFAIPPGVKDKERLLAEGQGHALPGLAPGDVILVCRMQEHQSFLRKGDDLLAEQHVPLQVALCGGAFEVPHLNGNVVQVRVPRGVVLAPGCVKCLPGEGMPKRHNPSLRGDLVLRFGVIFPESLTEDTAVRLERAFEGTGQEEDSTPIGLSSPTCQEGEVYLADFDMEQFGKTLNEAARQAYDEDEEEAQAAAARAAAAAGYAGQSRRRSQRTTYSHGFGGFGNFANAGSGTQCQQM